jgi:2-polyprenyl-3-methyl-5-hydroxy-6-metoxy-1,4-benzoquinol methylase
MGQIRATCNLCGSSHYHIRFYKPPYTRVQCDLCGLVWSLEQPNSAALAEMYGQSYFKGETYLDYAADQTIIEANARARLRALDPLVKPPGLIIDVGCATGFFLNVARAAGWTAKGVELSDYAAAYARNDLGLDVFHGTLTEAAFPSESAQLVTLWDVIEHVPDPMQTLREAAALLEPGGILVISTGDINSFISRMLGARWRLITYDHLFYFSAKSIVAYVRAVGLELVKIRYPGRLVSPSLVMHMFLNHYVRIGGLRKPLLNMAQLLPNLPLNFLDVMTVYTRKVGV